MADLNGDGLPDLIVSGQNAIVFFNNAANPGQFLPGYLTGFSAGSPVFVTDMNGDGVPDLVSGGSYLPGDPANPGQFLPAVSLNLPGSAIIQAVADFNGDGLPDVATLSNDFNEGATLQVLFNDPANPGKLLSATAVTVSSSASEATQAVAADINGDGTLDLIVNELSLPAPLGSGTQVFLGNPAQPGQFIAQPAQPNINLSNSVHADFNGDGLLDLASPAGNGIGTSFGADIASAYFSNVPVTLAGPNVLDASYSGDSNYPANVSPAVTVNVPVHRQPYFLLSRKARLMEPQFLSQQPSL